MSYRNNTNAGYNVLQSTKPQTIPYSLADSPIALLSWIYGKLHDWSDNYPWSDDEILTWVSIYAFSRAGPGAAHRIYYEVMQDMVFPYEKVARVYAQSEARSHLQPERLGHSPANMGEALGDVVFETENERGG
jgi:hypothetical protein